MPPEDLLTAAVTWLVRLAAYLAALIESGGHY